MFMKFHQTYSTETTGQLRAESSEGPLVAAGSLSWSSGVGPRRYLGVRETEHGRAEEQPRRAAEGPVECEEGPRLGRGWNAGWRGRCS